MEKQGVSEAAAADVRRGLSAFAKPPFGRYTRQILFAVASSILASIPLIPEFLGNGMDKD